MTRKLIKLDMDRLLRAKATAWDRVMECHKDDEEIIKQLKRILNESWDGEEKSLQKALDLC